MSDLEISDIPSIDLEMETENEIDAEFEDIKVVRITYDGGDTDNISVTTDNDNRVIYATLKQIQYDTKEDFPEIGSDKLIYSDKSNDTLWRYDTEKAKYVDVGSGLKIYGVGLGIDTGKKYHEVYFNGGFKVTKAEQEGRVDIGLGDLPTAILEHAIYDVSYDAQTGVLTFSRTNDNNVEIDLPLELIVKSGYYDEESKSIILVLANEETLSIPVNELLRDIYSKEEVDDKVEDSSSKIIMLGIDGVIEEGRVIYEVQDAETFMPYRTNQREFLVTGNLPVVGVLDDTLPVAITFGDTTYNVYSFLKGGDTPLTVGDLKSVMTYNTDTGYYLYSRMVFLETSDIVGFAIMPATITARQLDAIADLPKFTNKIYINMANRTSLAGVLTLPCVESSNFVVEWGDGNSTEYVEATTSIEHNYSDTNFAGWVYIYGDWKGIAYDSDSSARAYVVEQIIYDNNITNIPEKAFRYARNLVKAQLPDTILRFENRAFYYASKLNILNIPKNLQYIGTYGVARTSIREFDIPKTLTSVEQYAFEWDAKVNTKFNFEYGTTNLGGLLLNYSGVREIVVPASVASFSLSIDLNANIKATFLPTTPPQHNNISNFYVKTVLVPYSALKAYKTATNWTQKANKIYPIGGTYSETITIPSTAWDATTNSATVEVVGSTTEARNVIEFILLDADGKQAEDTYGLKGTQGTMQMTFTCEEIPKEDIKLYVVSTLTNY